MQSKLFDVRSTTPDQTVVAMYTTHGDAETAVRRLAGGGVSVQTVSIIGRNFETREDVQGFYQPEDAALVGAGQGAWFGGIFGFMAGAMGFFVFPAVGALMVLGPIAAMIAGAIGGAGIGALVNGMIALGIPKHSALKYQERLQSGEFLVVVHGTPEQASLAHGLLDDTRHALLQVHGHINDGPLVDSPPFVTKQLACSETRNA